MVKALFDTDILIDHLNAIPEARTDLQRYGAKAVSIVTRMEVMVGAEPDLQPATRGFLGGFEVIGIEERVAERAVELRRSHRLRLPDAVIWATAHAHELLLVTRNTRDFPADDPGVRAPYIL
jgi:predicted nucleic acid-binding protein